MERWSLAVAFAEGPGRTGWTVTALSAFSVAHGLSPNRQQVMWPRGVRSVGHDLNAWADAEMVAEFEREGARPLSEVIATRFAAHYRLKPAVGQLARSDAFHPLDTLRRTHATALAMWRCAGEPPNGRSWPLVLLYSACVLVWLADPEPLSPRLRRVVNASTRLLGAA